MQSASTCIQQNTFARCSTSTAVVTDVFGQNVGGSGFIRSSKPCNLTRCCSIHCASYHATCFSIQNPSAARVEENSVTSSPDANQMTFQVYHIMNTDYGLYNLNNVSSCKSTGHASLYFSNCATGISQMNTNSNNQMNWIYELGGTRAEVSKDNIVRNKKYKNEGGMFYTTDSGLSVTKSVIVSNVFYQLCTGVSGFPFKECIFYQNSFASNPPQLSAKPQTHAYNYVSDWECLNIPYMMTKGFTMRARRS